LSVFLSFDMPNITTKYELGVQKRGFRPFH
jgi:hypothetical protein